jgi:hypothetical protein
MSKSHRDNHAARKKRGPISFGFAGYLDDQMAARITWGRLEWLAKAEAERRGTNPIMAAPSKLRLHAKDRRDHAGWHVEMDDESVFLTMPFVKNWSNWS